MKKIYFVFGCSLLNVAAIFMGMFGTQLQFFLVPVLFFILGICLLKVNPYDNKKNGYLLIFGLYPSLMLISFISSFFIEGNYLGDPLVCALFLTIILIFNIFKKPLKSLLIWSGVFLSIITISTILLPNYYNYAFREENSYSSEDLPDIKVYDNNNNPVNLKEHKGKVIVLDIWDSSCGVCIKQFPKFEALKNDLIQNRNIEFYTVNLPLERDKRPVVENYTKPYSFETLYADYDVRNKLEIKKLPQYIIIDQDSKVRYVGTLNTGKFDFYKNFYSIINEIQNEAK